MAWITLDEARAACGASAGAADVLAWLDGLGAVVRTGRVPVTSRLYSRKYLLAQEVVTETREVRALARALAEFLADGLRSSNLVEHTYYVFAEGSTRDAPDVETVRVAAGPLSTSKESVWVSVTGSDAAGTEAFAFPTEGREVAAEARRTNEADGWTVALTETAYGVPRQDDSTAHVTATSNGKPISWAYSVLPGISKYMKTGAAVSKNSSRTFVFSYAGAVLFQTETTTVTEYPFLTKAEADKAVADNTADASYVRVSKSSGGITVWREVKSGTQKTASARYVGDGRGWTVSVTAVAYGHTGW